MLSIPAWFDWREVIELLRERAVLLSIPAWFDWRVICTEPDDPVGAAFNPSLVRLARRSKKWGHVDVYAFNPSLVRLAQEPAAGESRGQEVFQSQLGSIGAHQADEAQAAALRLSIPAWFDWRDQRGRGSHHQEPLSIPAWFDWRTPPDGAHFMSLTAFNPSLVRLAPHRHRNALTRPLAFNPSLVRLARRPQCPVRGGNARLSIPAWFDWRVYVRTLLPALGEPFNPSLVRLAPPETPHRSAHHSKLSIPAWFDWRGSPIDHSRSPNFSFNPSLVRLAPERLEEDVLPTRPFQSQLGSIGARL